MVYIGDMAGDTAYPVRKALAFAEEQWAQIRRFRFANEIKTQADAVRTLLGLATPKKNLDGSGATEG